MQDGTPRAMIWMHKVANSSPSTWIAASCGSVYTVNYPFSWNPIRVCSDGDKAMAEYDSIVARNPEVRASEQSMPLREESQPCR